MNEWLRKRRTLVISIAVLLALGMLIITISRVDADDRHVEAAPPSPSSEEPAPETNLLDDSLTAQFGQVIRYPFGLEITVSQPQVGRRTSTSSGDIGVRIVLVTVTMQNTSKKPIDTSGAQITATLNGDETSTIYDPAKGVPGYPGKVLQTGEIARGKVGFSLFLKTEGDLKIQVKPSTAVDAALFVGRA
jgi:hypothetical protein